MDKKNQLPSHIQKALKLLEFAGDNNNALQAVAGTGALTAAMIAQKRNAVFNQAQQNAYTQALQSAVNNRPNPFGVDRSLLETWVKNENPSLRNPPPMREFPSWISKAGQLGRNAMVGSIPYAGPLVNAIGAGSGSQVMAALGLLAGLQAPIGGSRRPDGTYQDELPRDPWKNMTDQERQDYINQLIASISGYGE
jgi:hypothetical protein